MSIFACLAKTGTFIVSLLAAFAVVAPVANATTATSTNCFRLSATYGWECDYSNGTDIASLVVSQNGSGYVTAFLDIYTGGGIHSLKGVVVLQQCSGTGSNCGNVAATSDSATTDFVHIQPSHGTSFSFGHTYKAVGSAQDFTTNWNVLNVSTPFIAN